MRGRTLDVRPKELLKDPEGLVENVHSKMSGGNARQFLCPELSVGSAGLCLRDTNLPFSATLWFANIWRRIYESVLAQFPLSRRWVDPIRKHGSGNAMSRSRLPQRNIRLCAEGDGVVLAAKSVVVSPVPASSRSEQQVQPTAKEDFSRVSKRCRLVSSIVAVKPVS